MLTIGHFILHVFSFLVVIIQLSESLLCYQCADTTYQDSSCIHDYWGMINATKDIQDGGFGHFGGSDVDDDRDDTTPYVKNCTDTNPRWDRCVIETHKGQRGSYSYFKRGCHDGKTFNKYVDDPEFHNLNANNATTCAFTGQVAVCFTFCQTDFCNGPQPEVDPCENFDPNDENATLVLPEGVVCGGVCGGIHGNIVMLFFNICISVVMYTMIFR